MPERRAISLVEDSSASSQCRLPFASRREVAIPDVARALDPPLPLFAEIR
jgi:hypothetical protein